MIIYQFQNTEFLPVGQYCFPFSFTISNNVPGSFYTDGLKYRASLIYKVGGFCDALNNKSGI
jgi:hypothetical protein